MTVGGLASMRSQTLHAAAAAEGRARVQRCVRACDRRHVWIERACLSCLCLEVDRWGMLRMDLDPTQPARSTNRLMPPSPIHTWTGRIESNRSTSHRRSLGRSLAHHHPDAHARTHARKRRRQAAAAAAAQRPAKPATAAFAAGSSRRDHHRPPGGQHRGIPDPVPTTIDAPAASSSTSTSSTRIGPQAGTVVDPMAAPPHHPSIIPAAAGHLGAGAAGRPGVGATAACVRGIGPGDRVQAAR